MHCRRGVLVLGLALVVAAGCARRRHEAAPQRSGAPVRVVVTNHFTAPMEVTAQGSNITYRLGIVHPGMTAEFVLPQAMIGGGTVELFAGTGGGRDARSGPLLLTPGAIVDFEIGTAPSNSTAVVRP